MQPEIVEDFCGMEMVDGGAEELVRSKHLPTRHTDSEIKLVRLRGLYP